MNFLKHALIATALLTSVGSFAKTLDRIVVVANNDVVTAAELNQRVAMIKQQYSANPSVLPNDAALQKQILDALILESLQLQLAERGNLQIPDAQVDNALNTLAQNQGMTLTQFLDAVKNSGRDLAQFRLQIKRELTVNEVQKQIVGRQVFISDAEVDRFLSSQSGQALKDTEYQLSYLRFEADQKDQAQQLLTQLNNGTSLLDTDGSRDLGMRSLEEVPSLFRTLVPVLKVGEAVLLERDNALHIAQLSNKTDVQSVNIEEYKIRHILVNTNELFDADSAQALLADLKSQIEMGASMAELADTYSQDNGSRGRGGDLDWNSLDTFVPEFALVAKNIPVGSVSKVFESPYGYHILRVEEVRTSDVGIDVLRKQIRNQLYQRRYSESLQRWLTELRAESFVEFRN
ncbi:peptidylprolyl isomerase [Reinekea sp. G2M2-21]|uniref:peptidylprolyl isomerase n=1 Tax=Reinekea sp. G2M2-21 TaxID=2788942 RepID=UPI0018AA5B3D|nr:peptidylprolyl isomerase [Reinekea sp. G2M2-21]